MVLAMAPGLGAEAPDGASVMYHDSIVEVAGPGSGAHARIVRQALTNDEQAAPLDIVVGLRMRAFGELEARIQRGQRVSPAEMEATYLPLRTDYENLASWLKGRGLAVTARDRNHTNIFVRGSVARISAALAVTFARVLTADGEFSSAITAPSIPTEFSGAVLGIAGLQPHVLMHAPRLQAPAGTAIGGTVVPEDILVAYDAPITMDARGLPITGSGQTIAIVMDSIPLESDLSAFWLATGTNYSLVNYSLHVVNGGPNATSQTTDAGEVALDVEWASAIAPGAKVRLYAIPALTLDNFLLACNEITNDGLATVVSYSAGGPEVTEATATMQMVSQTLAQMGAAGITLVASSGDGGSNPNPTSEGNGYDSVNPLTPFYPASDPNMTGVGGTTVSFDMNWNATSETAWSRAAVNGADPAASGGGISTFFARPTWQSGSGVPSGSMRCVPDVAAMAATDADVAGSFDGAFVLLNGQQAGFVGTSLSTPIWAGVVAMANQYRVSVGLPNFGLMNQWLYGLIGTGGVYDTTTGSNGAYYAGPGYDLCTGIGSPDISLFITYTTEEITANSAPAAPVALGTPDTMSVVPQFLPSTYQWQLNGVNIPGATGSVYFIPSAAVTDAGAYTVAITNGTLGTFTYGMGTLAFSAPANMATNTSRLINISTRAQVGTGGDLLIPGFVIGGTGTETLLIRADGPGLTQFGVGGVLALPSLSVYNSVGTVIASNTGWGTNPNPSLIASTAASVGAFALAPGSGDCALIASLPAGAYTVQISGVGATSGVALAEVYEVSASGTRLINISTRAQVGTGGNIIIPGFVISGGGAEQLLVRADGPALTQFGVGGVLASPSLSVYDVAGTVVASNTAWGTGPNPALVASTATAVGAFAFVSGSLDSAQIVNLAAGAYTIQISGVGNTTGVALAEIYESQ
jgi:kumamolisin